MNVIKKTIFFCLCLVFFGSCGDLGTVLPKYNTYHISALLNSNIQLEEYSLVRENDSLSPYCDKSIVNDPDVRALQVIFQNHRKETMSARVRYVLNISDTGNSGENDGRKPPSGTPGGFEDTNIPIAERTDVFVPLAEYQYSDIPAEDEPEIVYPSIESDNDEPALTEENENQFQAETGQVSVVKIGDEEIVFNVNRLDTALPNFSLPDDLRIGQYTMIIRVLGEYETLGEVELPFYFLGNAKFSLKDIVMYLPGASSESRLIPPGTTVLLEAKVEADERLNPYIVWFSGNTPVEEGKFSDGAGLIFWKAPEQNGFQSLRAEIFPSQNHDRISGISREIVLPVSAKAVKADFLSEQKIVDFFETDSDSQDEAADKPGAVPVTARLSEMLHRYQFASVLNDSLNPQLAEKALNPKVVDKAPRWKPMTYSYGLSTGPFDVYELPRMTFVRKSAERGGSLFLFRIKPFSDGTILNAALSSADISEEVPVELFIQEGNLSLLIGENANSADKISIPINSSASGYPVITAALVFYFFQDYVEAQLIVEKNQTAQIRSTKFRVSGLLNGVCRLSLGKPDTGAAEVSTEEAAGESSASGGRGYRRREERNGRQNAGSRNQPISAVWDQLAILYIEPPEPVKELAGESDSAESAVVSGNADESEPIVIESSIQRNNSETIETESEYAGTITEQVESELHLSAVVSEYFGAETRDNQF